MAGVARLVNLENIPVQDSCSVLVTLVRMAQAAAIARLVNRANSRLAERHLARNVKLERIL
jgi:hypothetical protein